MSHISHTPPKRAETKRDRFFAPESYKLFNLNECCRDVVVANRFQKCKIEIAVEIAVWESANIV